MLEPELSAAAAAVAAASAATSSNPSSSFALIQPDNSYPPDDIPIRPNWSPSPPLSAEQARPIARVAKEPKSRKMTPGKRPGPGSDVAEGSHDGGASNPKLKLPRLDRGPEDFSSVVKNKLQTYTRTGQACDRCKVCFLPRAASPRNLMLILTCLCGIGPQDTMRCPPRRLLPLHQPKPRMLCHGPCVGPHRASRLLTTTRTRQDRHAQPHSGA